MFCEVVGRMQHNSTVLKTFIELDYVSILLTFVKGKNEIVSRFSISLVESLRRNASGKVLRKHTKGNSCTATMAAMAETKNFEDKRLLCSSLMELLRTGDSDFKEEFMLPVNFGPFLTSLKSLLTNRHQLTTAPGPHLQEALTARISLNPTTRRGGWLTS